VLSEDIEDQRRPVDKLDVLAERLLQFALVPRRQLIIEEDDVGGEFANQGNQFRDLPWTNERGRVRPFTTLGRAPHRSKASAEGQLSELGKRVFQPPMALSSRACRAFEIDPDHDGPLRRRTCWNRCLRDGKPPRQEMSTEVYHAGDESHGSFTRATRIEARCKEDAYRLEG
jgi:hypothetical protein